MTSKSWSSPFVTMVGLALSIGSAILVAQTPIQSGFGAGAYRPDNGVIAPSVALRVEPDYTRWALALPQPIEGSAQLEALVNVDGSVGDIRITTSLDAANGLDAEAMHAVRQWRFHPGTRNGQAVPVVMSLSVPLRIPGRAPVAGEPPSTESGSAFAQGAYGPDTPGLVAARVTYELHPWYTLDATHAKLQGDVWLQAIVRDDGSIGKVRLTKSIDPENGLDQKAVNAMRQWKYTPATLNGRPVASVVDAKIPFRLH